MQEQTVQYLMKNYKAKRTRHTIRRIVACLSLAVVLSVFWGLKLTGITMAGEAFCGQQEHVHTEECASCTMQEHTHTSACYSNIEADLETAEDWEQSLAGLERATTTAQNVILVAQSQLGQKESVLNFQVDGEGVQRGITRYGQWYGNPYGDWSVMFASFCLYYGGVEDVPVNGGAESMRTQWQTQELYRAAADYTPQPGNLLFLDKSADGEADALAIIVGSDASQIAVIEGDLDGAVAETAYDLTDPVVMGYGLVPEVSGYVALAAPPETAEPVASATQYSAQLLNDSANRFVFYVENAGRYYAIDGSGNAVEIYLDDQGRIYTNADPNSLLWAVSYYNNNSRAIANVGTGRYLHPFYNSGADNGITTPGRWGTTMSASGTGVRFTHSAYIRFDPNTPAFLMSRTQSQNTTFRVGIARQSTVWFDGTQGGIMSLGGSPNTSYSVISQSKLQLPEQWESPDKYDYVLAGWYDIVNHKYYKAGQEVVITGDTVFYADWQAASYDVGQFNADVVDTVSTNSFVTTRLFDYNALMNLLSENVNVSVSSSGHSETWQLLTSGNNPYNGQPTLNFIFRDWDRGGEDISYPNGHNAPNNPTDAGQVYPGLYSDTIAQLLFDPELQMMGKTYLGQGDHLFQLCLDPNHDHYGYYYYNSERNAASYNQSAQRFYIYDYLECTIDSGNSSDAGKYADFLPLNSPYMNTNGNRVQTYSYNGVEGEYVGTTHYMYDSRYNDSGNSVDRVGTNFWFGMSMDVEFYLPNQPGTRMPDGTYGNLDVYGTQMHFKFTGDDDVWIFVDGKMVLDLGGLHGMESGDINFSTGAVTINGVRNNALSNTLQSIQSGEHVLTLYYLERGSSMSNCAIYFNLAPRFDFTIQKEDVLTRDVLNGAQFSVYTDRECTKPAQLWTSKEAYERGESSSNVFTVVNGVAHMWGMGAGNTYYIRETKPPDDPQYGFANGLIHLTLDQLGQASYQVEILDEGNGVSGGFTVHGFRIDLEMQKAYIIATNAPQWVKEVTSVTVTKKWNDQADHGDDSITAYLTVRDPDGTIRRIREVILGPENHWTYTWENLPKTYEDGSPVIYGVQEATVPGYVGKIERVDAPNQDSPGDSPGASAGTASAFESGNTYLLSTPYGYLGAANNKLLLENNRDAALNSNNTQWTATVNSDGTVVLTTKSGQTLYYDNYSFKAGSSPGQYRNLHFADGLLWNYINYGSWADTQYPVAGDNVASNIQYNSVLYTTNSANSAFKITLEKLGGAPPPTPEPEVPVEGDFFQITNTPAGKNTTLLEVRKVWNGGNAGLYQTLTAHVELLANGQPSGMSCELDLQNGWQYTFYNLPMYDSSGVEILYTVRETPPNQDWTPSYSAVTSIPGGHTVTITNTYHPSGPELPSTGVAYRLMYILCGSGIMLGSLVYGIGSRRKRERRMQ